MNEATTKQDTYTQKELNERRREQANDRKKGHFLAKLAIGATVSTLAIGIIKGSNSEYSTDKLASEPQKTLVVETGDTVDGLNAEVNPEMTDNAAEIQGVRDSVKVQIPGEYLQPGAKVNIPDFDPSTGIGSKMDQPQADELVNNAS